MGLLAHRTGAHRRFYSAAVARALLLAQMPPQQVASLTALRNGGELSRRLAVLIGSVMASVADSAELSERARDEILQDARSLMDHREAFADFPGRAASAIKRAASSRTPNGVG